MFWGDGGVGGGGAEAAGNERGLSVSVGNIVVVFQALAA